MGGYGIGSDCVCLSDGWGLGLFIVLSFVYGDNIVAFRSSGYFASY